MGIVALRTEAGHSACPAAFYLQMFFSVTNLGPAGTNGTTARVREFISTRKRIAISGPAPEQ